MEKNQNGYPVSPMTDRNDCHNRFNEQTCVGGLDTLPLAQAYVPMQKFRMLYSAERALAHGTLFEELFLPVEVYGK